RDFHVTGVQTCALPIYLPKLATQEFLYCCRSIHIAVCGYRKFNCQFIYSFKHYFPSTCFLLTRKNPNNLLGTNKKGSSVRFDNNVIWQYIFQGATNATSYGLNSNHFTNNGC